METIKQPIAYHYCTGVHTSDDTIRRPHLVGRPTVRVPDPSDVDGDTDVPRAVGRVMAQDGLGLLRPVQLSRDVQRGAAVGQAETQLAGECPAMA